MQIFDTNIPDVKLLKPKKFGDARGFFLESYNKKVFDELLGMKIDFVQDNHSRSAKGVLRGLHYQIRHPQGKLVRVTAGEVFDVAVDMRRDSPTFGQWAGTILTADGQEQFWVPEGFAHGFLVLSETADFLYKTTNYYAPEYDRSVLWNDKNIGIEWPISDILQPTLSDKDQKAVEFMQADYF
ncbi:MULTISPECIES: dTDP-4-dehydrorhamnose 3,5-epimerase [unclassified Methylophaga]|jgi:dTDP-4-dehydrorhamnose 3,5-epimerase|uniref:dTDP-4-dehydrorhamnose 3,5-epimerase n=1 Tax=unclassified Methylophaga TaxID=2629249 RepID=UPI000C94901D|nr:MULTISPECIES: dTDP-4-dehydrorhamnose 3,5-epimerase [unclassified Methylophaga]MAK67002.1 dTDP-4-dehydrorhamnose 3,5-epimerase [Methylophaga sp.]MAY18039.1 dTDP-4-dehydrorhamnose 3,5-epimerase [Methylophaga sp.]HAO26462.1 dTDP-4-dehydrorhamnose 3,5-epimerase [Methylophaga sp.]HCD05654.1 dTDP-4-dehydrorhamnose 3,5-epimerase [Methylophaga sp.]|tara:strand:+ start:2073 stop:2621 length:549 start_codon:yes stop_codon:yes gene_type:complete